MNYTINRLNSEEAANRYKIAKIKSIEFKPKIITTRLVELYINYSKYDSFKKSCIEDIRSFDEKVFERTI